jgi:hypothetical protein
VEEVIGYLKEKSSTWIAQNVERKARATARRKGVSPAQWDEMDEIGVRQLITTGVDGSRHDIDHAADHGEQKTRKGSAAERLGEGDIEHQADAAQQ